MKYRDLVLQFYFAMIENPSYDRVLADQEDKTKLPKFQLYQINRGDFIGTYIVHINLMYIQFLISNCWLI